MNISGKSLELFFIDGKPDGMLTAEVFNWTGHVLRIPRTQLQQGLGRSEAGNTGVYVLIGEKDGSEIAYIGEAEDMGARLKQHAAGKDWWDTAILVSTTGDMLHKAHVKYLESRLVEIATSVGATRLENGNIPARSSLTEAAQANMESFIETLNMVLPAIRVDIFAQKKRQPKQEQQTTQDNFTFKLQSSKHGVEATAILVEGEMVVQKGSKARKSFGRYSNDSYEKLHKELIANGTLVITGDHAIFSTNYAFNSPSAAAAVINGRASNGRQEWREVSSGLKYVEWEAQQLAMSNES